MVDIIDNEDLIRAVQKQPILWDKNHTLYKDRKQTRHAWTALFRELNGQFDRLDQWKKHEFGQAVIKRWSNIRDCFQRSERRMQYSSAYRIGTTRRKYIYSELLQFLKKNKSNQPTDETLSNDDQSILCFENTETVAEELEVPEALNQNFEVENAYFVESDPQEKTLRNLPFIQDVVPFLETLSEDDMLEFQLKVLQAVSDLKHRGKKSSDIDHMDHPSTSYGLRTSQGLQYHSLHHQNAYLTSSSSQRNKESSANIQKILKHPDPSVNSSAEPDVTPSAESSDTRQNRKRQIPPSSEETSNHPKRSKTCSQPHSRTIPPTYRNTESSSRLDEFDTFGQHVASQLRNLPLSNAIVCQNFINSYLSEERLKVINAGYVPNLGSTSVYEEDANQYYKSAATASTSSLDPQEDNLDEDSSDHNLESIIKIENDVS